MGLRLLDWTCGGKVYIVVDVFCLGWKEYFYWDLEEVGE